MPTDSPILTSDEWTRYEWQLAMPGLGREGQQKLKQSTVLISRCGGVGGATAYALAAAGVGRLILAHAGPLRVDDLNRQWLMNTGAVGHPRIEAITRRLAALNPHVHVVAVPENINAANAPGLVAQADVVVDAAPLFAERFALNAASVAAGHPMVECAMLGWEMHLTTFRTPATPCLACLYPEAPPDWTRKFPVLGAVAGSVGMLAAAEVVKVITGAGPTLEGRMLVGDLGRMSFQTVRLWREPGCVVCKPDQPPS